MTRPLIIVCDWIPPAFGAVGQYQLARAREAARAGRPTTLIGLGTDPDDLEDTSTEGADGESLRIIRLAARPPNKARLWARAFWAVGTNLRLIGATVRTLKRRDNAELKVTGSPPFLAYLLIVINALFLRRMVTYRITDFYPETALAANQARILRPLLPVFHWLRRRASNLEVLSECQERRLQEAGIPSNRIRIVRDESPVDFSLPAATPARPYPRDKTILLYSGNLGIAHDVDTFAEAYRRHVVLGTDRVRLWLNATGVKVDQLKAYCEEHGLPVHITPPAPLKQLSGILLSADAHLVTLEEPFWGYVIPSKIYACIESQRPVLYIGPKESDVHMLVSGIQGSASIRNGDVEACYTALDALAKGHHSDSGRGGPDSVLNCPG